MKKHTIVALDFESILVPEIWPVISSETGIKELAVTSREFPDFHELTSRRIQILKERNLKVADIQAITEKLEPLSGAPGFLNKLRKKHQVVIISGGLDKFIDPLIKKLGHSTVFSYTLELENSHEITGFKPLEKHDLVKSFKKPGIRLVAVGDSTLDIKMLEEADEGILFNAPDDVTVAFPQFPSLKTYEELEDEIN